jgi:hypothetical protein
MKNLMLVTTAALISVSAADVQIFSDTACRNDYTLVTTKHGKCYTIDNLSPSSAKGCSFSHDLRVYTEPGCAGTYGTKSPQKCINLGGSKIQSIKCL